MRIEAKREKFANSEIQRQVCQLTSEFLNFGFFILQNLLFANLRKAVKRAYCQKKENEDTTLAHKTKVWRILFFSAYLPAF